MYVTTDRNKDQVLRAMTIDASFRVITAITSNTVGEIVHRQNPPTSEVEHLGELVAGTILVRETMSPNLRVQGILRGAKSTGTLVADSHPDGSARGLVSILHGAASLDMGDGATLTMMRSLPGGRNHQGIVALKNTTLGKALRRSSQVSDALMSYMDESEQVRSMIDVSCVIRDNNVLVAGGYIVQLLPELKESQLMIMTERLTEFPSMASLLSSGHEAAHVLNELLYGMPYSLLSDSPLRFECKCSHMGVIACLATLNSDEIKRLISEGEPPTISCEFCGAEYSVTIEQLHELLKGILN